MKFCNNLKLCLSSNLKIQLIMRFDSFLLNTLSIVTHFGFVGTQSRCKDIPYSLGMSDLVNFGCKLVRGVLTLKFKNICEGEPCPGLGPNSICANGKCIDRSGGSRVRTRISSERRPSVDRPEPRQPSRPRPTQRRRPVKGAGKLDVVIVSAILQDTDTLINSAPDSYAMVCMHSGDKRESTSSPTTERENCYCRTPKLEDNNNPFWEYSCETIDVNKFNQSSTVLTIETYDQEVIADDEFIAGNDITVQEVIENGNNGKPFDLELFGPYSGSVTLNITWTPIR